jgi:hypothetical protein
MSQMEKPSAYVSRCCDALEKYSALRFTGVTHEGAVKLSGLYEAVCGKVEPAWIDVKQKAAGRDE